MNERIKGLAEQALKTSMLTDGVYRPEGYANAVSKDFADNFAKLLLQECMNITGGCSTRNGLYADVIIAEYFGVSNE